MTTMNPETIDGALQPPALPEALLFEPDGHLTEAALACVADGEIALVPAAAMSHLDGCDRCSHRLGAAALLSLDVSAAAALLRAARPEERSAFPDPAPVVAPQAALIVTSLEPYPPARSSGLWRRRPLPVAAIAAALALAVLTAGPSLVTAIQGVPAMIAGAVEVAPFLVRVAAAFVRAPWGAEPSALLVKGVSALVLAAVGLGVARLTSRSRSTMEDPWQQGGV
jgi:hypothetical protein